MLDEMSVKKSIYDSKIKNFHMSLISLKNFILSVAPSHLCKGKLNILTRFSKK